MKKGCTSHGTVSLSNSIFENGLDFMAIFKSKFYPFHTSQKNRVSNVAVKVAVTKNLVAVKGPQVAVVSDGSGSEGLPGSGNPGSQVTSPRDR